MMAQLENHDPFALFTDWLALAEEKEINDYNAMGLATVGEEGQASLRMVLLKGHDENGFVFYTNLSSRKGEDIRQNQQVALLFHWKSLRRQVRIEGIASKVADEEADEYFASRPYLSQIGAWASKQSQPLASKLTLEERAAKTTLRHPLGNVPRPPHWSGFRVKPHAMEFWQDGAFRMHDRWRFELGLALEDKRKPYQFLHGDWQINRLYP